MNGTDLNHVFLTSHDTNARLWGLLRAIVHATRRVRDGARACLRSFSVLSRVRMSTAR